MNVVRCPHCNVRITYNGSRDGQTVPCPKCHNPFQFPAATQGSPVPTSDSRPDLLFAGDPEPACGSGSKDPWFYDFLESYARFGMWLGIVFVLLTIVLMLSGMMIYIPMESEKIDGGGVALLLFLFLVGVVILLPFLLAIVFWTALLPLAVDIGRTLRGIRRNVRP